MTKKLEELLNLPTDDEPLVEPTSVDTVPTINLEERLEEFDKIASALPRVKGLGDMADVELDALANKAEQAYDDLMDLGMNVEARFSGTILQTAGVLLGHAISAKQAKIDKKLRMVDLQLKKLRLDQTSAKDPASNAIEGQATVIDRNELLNRILQQNKAEKSTK